MRLLSRTYLLLTPILLIGVIKDSLEYLLLSLVSAAAGVFLLAQLGAKVRLYLPIWVIFIVLLWGYFGKFLAVTVLPESVVDQYLGYPASELVWDPYLLLDSYYILTVAFVAFCIISGLLILAHRGGRTTGDDNPRRDFLDLTHVYFLISYGGIAVCLVVTGAVQWAYGLAILGTESVELPYRLTGIIVHSQNILIPYLLLVLLDCSWRSNHPAWGVVCMGTLFLHGVTQTTLTTSRGMVFYMLFPALFLWVLRRGQINWKGVMIMGVVLGTVLASYRLVTELRWYEVEQKTRNVTGGFSTVASDYDVVDSLGQGIAAIFFRMTGLDGLLTAVYHPAPAFDLDRITLLFTSDRNFSRIFTEEYAGLGFVENHQNAPGLLGGLMFMSGLRGLVVLFCAGVTLIYFGWQFPWSSIFTTGVAMKSYMAFLVLYFTESGSFDEMFKVLLTGFAFLCGEILVRLATVGSSAGPRNLSE